MVLDDAELDHLMMIYLALPIARRVRWIASVDLALGAHVPTHADAWIRRRRCPICRRGRTAWFSQSSVARYRQPPDPPPARIAWKFRMDRYAQPLVPLTPSRGLRVSA